MREAVVFGVGLCEIPPDPDFGEVPCAAGPVYQRRDSLTYDALGNITYVSDTLSVGVPTYATSGNRAKIKTWPNLIFATDSAGNVTQRIPTVGATTNFYWNADGLLDSTKVGSRTAFHEYNALGQLVRKRVLFSGIDSTQYRRHFYWDAGHLLAELDSNLAKRRSEYAYYPGVDQPLALLTGATMVTSTRFMLLDLSGNVTGLLTTANTVDSYASE